MCEGECVEECGCVRESVWKSVGVRGRVCGRVWVCEGECVEECGCVRESVWKSVVV